VSTAIAVYNSGGCVGRCDAKCHYASAPDCDCICGGRLHGSGQGAIEKNTRDLLGDELTDELRAFAARNGLDVDELRVEVPGVQLELGGGA
jgi:hypothetical protein